MALWFEPPLGGSGGGYDCEGAYGPNIEPRRAAELGIGVGLYGFVARVDNTLYLSRTMVLFNDVYRGRDAALGALSHPSLYF